MYIYCKHKYINDNKLKGTNYEAVRDYRGLHLIVPHRFFLMFVSQVVVLLLKAAEL